MTSVQAHAEDLASGKSGVARRRRPTVQRTLFWVLLLLAAYFIPRGEYSNPDSHLALTYALVEQHSLRIDSFLEVSGSHNPVIDKAVYCGPHTNAKSCKHYYTDKAPGVSLVGAVAYSIVRPLLPASMIPTKPGSDRFLLRWLLTLLSITVPCAFFLGLYWRFMSRLAGPIPALIVACGYGYGSIALPFSTLVFSHALSAALLFTAFILLFDPTVASPRSHTEQIRVPAGHRGRTWKPAAAGALAGYALGCEYPAAIIGGLLGLYALSGTPASRVRVVGAYAIGLVLGLLPLALYNLAAFGSLFSQGYLHLTDPYFARGMNEGILGVGLPRWDAVWGTTFSPYRGLFILSPWLLLAFPGVLRMLRSPYRREAVLCIAISVCYFIFQSGYAFWDGGASVGPRHFLPALPFLALPVVFILDVPLIRRIASILVGISAASFLLILSTRPTFPMGLQNPLWNETLHDLRSGHLQNNWGTLFHLPGVLSVLPLLAGLVLLARQARARLAP